MSTIKISKLSFAYEGSSKEIFQQFDLNIDSSWKLGLVGRNGRGKTTFLNLLLGKLTGTGKIFSTLKFNYFPQNISDPKNLTIYELQELATVEQWELERELTLLHLDTALLWQPFSSLSGGEKTKMLLALAFADKDGFPLLDEPTNHLDEASREHVANYLQHHHSGYILVSHDRAFLNQTTDHTLAIENQEIHLYQGNFEQYEEVKRLRDEYNQAKNERLKGEISRLTQVRGNYKDWSHTIENQKKSGQKTAHVINRRTQLNKGAIGHKAEKMMRKAMNVERRIEKNIAEKQGLMTNIEESPMLTMNFVPDYHHTLLSCKNFKLQYDDDKTALFENQTFLINNHEITAIIGSNGVGKTSLLKNIFSNSENLTRTGELNLVEDLKISYLPQEFSKYRGKLEEFAEQHQLSYEMLLNNLKKMGFPREDFALRIEEMSMGQQKRVAIAKSLTEEANLYLWDEPANYLDVFNQDQLIKLLKEIKPAMILIEHDKYFVDQVADQIIALKKIEKI